MSASNWSICPRCRVNARAAVVAAYQEAADAYGKVPALEYEELRRAAGTLAAQSVEATFREDYEFFGAEDGVITARYSGYCGKCDLSTSFTHTHEFYEPPSCDNPSCIENGVDRHRA